MEILGKGVLCSGSVRLALDCKRTITTNHEKVNQKVLAKLLATHGTGDEE
jgi:hypothetical protein